MAEHAHTTSTDRRTPASLGGRRRSLFGAAAALLMAPAASAVPMPDAGLFRLCRAFHDAHQVAENMPDDGPWQGACARRWEIIDQIRTMVPTTAAGRLAKGRVALVLMEEDTSNGSMTHDSLEGFVLTTLRELAGAAV